MLLRLLTRSAGNCCRGFGLAGHPLVLSFLWERTTQWLRFSKSLQQDYSHLAEMMPSCMHKRWWPAGMDTAMSITMEMAMKMQRVVMVIVAMNMVMKKATVRHLPFELLDCMPYFWVHMPHFLFKGLLCHADPHCTAYFGGILFADMGGGGGHCFHWWLLSLIRNTIAAKSTTKIAFQKVVWHT